MQVISQPNPRTLILMNQLGDVEISWDSNQDEAMREIIQKKMDEGIKFFMVNVKGTKVSRKRLKDMDDLQRYRINVADDDIKALFETGKVEFARRDTDTVHVTTHRTTSAAEAASGASVAVPQFKGG
jgi:hypothetical protein